MDNVKACESELWETTDSEDDTVDASDDDLSQEGESESLSDIDDIEIGSYIMDDKQKQYKKIIWDSLNKKYLQEQEAKKVATASNVTKSKRELRPKKATKMKKVRSTGAHPTLPKNRPSSRINYNALSEVIDDSLSSGNPQKRRSSLESDNIVGENPIGSPVGDDATDEREDNEHDWEDDANYSHYNNQEEEYEFYDDDGFL